MRLIADHSRGVRIDMADTSLSSSSKILVVDDFAVMRKMMRRILNEIGLINVTEACNGSEALTFLSNDNYDLIITDWDMPVMSGANLLKAMWADRQLKALPVLVVTAVSDKERMIEAAKANVNGYILKPFTPEELQGKIGRIFQRI